MKQPDSSEAAWSTARGGALEGIRIVDLTSIVLGPLATRLLGDHGADVVKVEAIGGDLTRVNGTVRAGGLSSNFLAMNRNKRSIAVDLKTGRGVEIARRLIASADVLVHNIRVAGIERLGLGYEAVRAMNPRIIYCAATGFAQDGPHRDRPAFDDIIQAASGVASLVGQQHGQPDFMPTLIADKTAALAVVNAILAAMVHRERTGEGQYVEVPMFETIVDFMLAEHMGGLSFEPSTEPAGYRRIMSGGRRLLPTKDGHMAALPYTVAQWQAFFDAVGQPQTMADLGVLNKSDVNAKGGLLYGAMAAITPDRTTQAWMAQFEALDIAATPMYSLDDLPEHPQLASTGMFQAMTHPTQGEIRTFRPVARFSASPQRVGRLAPELGEHSLELMDEIGYSKQEVDSLLADGVAVAYGRQRGATGTHPTLQSDVAHVSA